MDAIHADLLKNHQSREAYWAARDAKPATVVAAVVAAPAEVSEWDIALAKRATVRLYVRKRNALRALVQAGVFTPEQARATSALTNLRTKWLALYNWRDWA